MLYPYGQSGTILDDGRLGEAEVNGTQDGLLVRFTKRYHGANAPDGKSYPVFYEGVLSEDGMSMQGTWSFQLPYSGSENGVWDARRHWFAAETEESVLESVSVTGSDELVRV